MDEQRKLAGDHRNKSSNVLEPFAKKTLDEGRRIGNIQEVRSIRVDCDGDVVLLKVNQIGGAACHTGHRTCFYREIVDGGQEFKESNEIIFDPKTVYGKPT